SLLGSESTIGSEGTGTLAITDSELLGEFDSEVFGVADSAPSFDNLAIESAEFLRNLDGLGIVDARHILKLLVDSGQPLDQVSLAEVTALLGEKELLTRWQVDRLAKKSVPESLVLGDYVLLDPLGKGGMGIVYRARHRRMDRLVALKTLTDRATESDDSVQRFQREVRAAARLSHPNIVAAYDAGEHNETDYLVMELVDGIDLSKLVRQSGPLNASRAVDYVRQAAVGFAYAHTQGIIHRDIKPQNLLVDRNQHVRILDMGLARLNPTNAAADPAASAGAQTELTQSGVIMGTVDFMSPEQATNTRNANEQSDIYSLGCTLYFLMTGRAMFDGETCMERLLAHHQDSRPSLVTTVSKIPPALEAVFASMTARQPSDRYESMGEVVEALESVQSSIERPDQIALPFPAIVVGNSPGELPEFFVNPDVPEATFITRDVPVVGSTVDRFDRTTSSNVNTGALLWRSKQARVVAIAIGLCLAVWGLWPETGSGTPGSEIVGVGQSKNGLDEGKNGPGEGATPPVLESLKLRADIDQPTCDWPEASANQLRQRDVAKEHGITPFVENTIGMVLAVVPADNSGGKPFLVSTTEVTVGQFATFVDDLGYELQSTSRFGYEEGIGWHEGDQYDFRNLGDFVVTETLPACSICWLDAQAFCEWLSEREKVTYRLPTVEEWQAANAAGSTTRWFFGDDDERIVEFAWIRGNSRPVIHNVGGKRPNALGLFDTLGNEFEWCLGDDRPGGSASGRRSRPQLGGGFGSPPLEIYRWTQESQLRSITSGLNGAFRVVREL
ncbi:MAG: protein kinase domain-containing protein, partial [Planctomycetales bacterium]